MVVDPNVLLSVPESVLNTWLTQLSKSLETYWSTVMYDVFGHAAVLFDAIPADDKIALSLLLGDTTELPKSVISLIDPSLPTRFIDTKYLNWEWFRETLTRGDRVFAGVLVEALGVIGGNFYEWMSPKMQGVDEYRFKNPIQFDPETKLWKDMSPHQKALRHLDLRMKRPCTLEDARLLKKAIDKEDYITMSALLEKYTGRTLDNVLLFFGLLLEDDRGFFVSSTTTKTNAPIGFEFIGLRTLAEVDLELSNLDEPLTNAKRRLDEQNRINDVDVTTIYYSQFIDWFRENRQNISTIEDASITFLLENVAPSLIRPGTRELFYDEWKLYRNALRTYMDVEEKVQAAWFERESIILKIKRDSVSATEYLENEIYEANAKLEKLRKAISNGANAILFNAEEAEFALLIEDFLTNPDLYDPEKQGKEAVEDLLKERGFQYEPFLRVRKYFNDYLKTYRALQSYTLDLGLLKKKKKAFQSNTFFVFLAIWMGVMAYILIQHVYPACIDAVTENLTALTGSIKDVYNALYVLPGIGHVLDIVGNGLKIVDNALQARGIRTFDMTRLHPKKMVVDVIAGGHWTAAGLSFIFYRAGFAGVSYTFNFGWAICMASSRIATDFYYEGTSIETLTKEWHLLTSDINGVVGEVGVTATALLLQLAYIGDVQGKMIMEGLKIFTTYSGAGSVFFPGLSRITGKSKKKKNLPRNVEQYVDAHAELEDEPTEEMYERIDRRRRLPAPDEEEEEPRRRRRGGMRQLPPGGSSNNDNNAPYRPPRRDFSRAASAVARNEPVPIVEAEEEDQDETSRRLAEMLQEQQELEAREQSRYDLRARPTKPTQRAADAARGQK
jgi:hypothetical protein